MGGSSVLVFRSLGEGRMDMGEVRASLSRRSFSEGGCSANVPVRRYATLGMTARSLATIFPDKKHKAALQVYPKVMFYRD